MTQDGFFHLDDAAWGVLRVVYLQHASDPMTFFSTDIAYKNPDWLGPNRGRDISPHLKWFPIVSFFQIAFDIPMATSVPLGYGHNFAPAEYIDAWIEVTQPGFRYRLVAASIRTLLLDILPTSGNGFRSVCQIRTTSDCCCHEDLVIRCR